MSVIKQFIIKDFEHRYNMSRFILRQGLQTFEMSSKIRSHIFDHPCRVTGRSKLTNLRNIFASNYAFLYNEYDILSKEYERLFQYVKQQKNN
jgi:hypothetical protein